MELPTVRGLYVCEHVIVEAETRNVSLINTFTTKKVDVFPSAAQRLSLFCTMTNGHGTVPLEITIFEMRSGGVIFARTVHFPFEDPVLVHRLIYRFTDLSFPDAGEYEIILATNRELIASTWFRVIARNDR